MARGSGYTKEYLARLFRREVGKSFSEYVLELRIDEAKELLSAGKPCREVAYLLQFCPQSYFIEGFKHITGVTPGYFSRKIKPLSPKI